MSKSILSAGLCLAMAAGALYAQTPATPAPLEFEVASVKPATMPTQAQIASGKIHAGMKVDKARVDIGLTPMLQLITKAYDVKAYQVKGPDWTATTMFDIVAKMPDGATKEQVPQMLQALLASRFKMVMHREKKDQSVYALVVDKGGPKLTPFKPDAEAQAAADGPATGSSEVSVKQSASGATVSDGTGMSQKMTPSADGKSYHFEITKVSMALLCDSLFRYVGRPIVDTTDLKGDYNLTLDITIADIMAVARQFGAAGAGGGGGGGDASHPADVASEGNGSSVVDSLKALGLKLEARKLPVDLIVIDSIEKTPTEN